MLGTSVKIADVNMQQPALVDQGATHSFIRRSALSKLMNTTDPTLIDSLPLQIRASNAYDAKLLINEAVLTRISLDNKEQFETVLLVVEDDDAMYSDLPADVVIGAATLLKCGYPLIDLEHRRLLSSLSTADDHVQLHRVVHTNTTNKRHLAFHSVPETWKHGDIVQIKDRVTGTAVTTYDADNEQLYTIVFPSPTSVELQQQLGEAYKRAEIDEKAEAPNPPTSSAYYSPQHQAKRRAAFEKHLAKQPNLTPLQQQQLLDAIYAAGVDDVFSIDGDRMGHTTLMQHNINTGTASPVHQQLRQHPDSLVDMIKKEVERMLAMDVIEKSNSEYASNVLIVWKSDGSPRFCVDYRELNNSTVKDRFPLPNIQQIYRKVGHSLVFSKLDLEAGFWQVNIDPRDRHKTAFITPLGLYQFKRMPFGLCNAPALFQRLMNQVIDNTISDFTECYVDDVLIHSATFDQHLVHLIAVLRRLKACGLTVKLTKCSFAQAEVKYLGCRISYRTLRPDSERVQAVLQWNRLRDVRSVRMFLGLANYYRQFIPRFADIAAPLYHLLRKDQPFVWAKEQQKAFEQLQQALTTPPTLTLPDPNKDYVLRTDASATTIGAVLLQPNNNGQLQPVAYASHKLNSAQQNYHTTERELYALVWALEHFNCYLFQKLTWITDHNALTFINTCKKSSPSKRINRWLLSLQNYDLKATYEAGTKLKDVDALSRLLTDPEGTAYIANITISTLGHTPQEQQEQLSAAQRHDEFCQRLFSYVEQKRPSHPSHFHHDSAIYRDVKKSTFFVDDDGLLYRLWDATHGARLHPQLTKQLVVPGVLRERIISDAHTGVGGHAGFVRTYEQLRERAWWPSMAHDINLFINRCAYCQQAKALRRAPIPLQPFTVPQGPWQIVGMDTIGPLPVTAKGNKYIAIMIDYFTRVAEHGVLAVQNSETLADTFIHNVVCRHGLPLSLITDNAAVYTSTLIEQIFFKLGLKHTTVTPYHPQANGMVERVNGTIISIIKTWAMMNPNDWDEKVPYAIFSYNSSFHTTLKTTPFFLEYCRHVRLPLDLSLGRESQSYENYDTYTMHLNNTIFSTYKQVQDIQEEINKQRQDVIEERQRDIPIYAVGDQIYLRDVTHQDEKFASAWTGPYPVVRKVNDVCYDVTVSGQDRRVSVSNMRRHYPPTATHLALAEDLNLHRLLLHNANEQLARVQNEQAYITQRTKELEDEYEQFLSTATTTTTTTSTQSTADQTPLIAPDSDLDEDATSDSSSSSALSSPSSPATAPTTLARKQRRMHKPFKLPATQAAVDRYALRPQRTIPQYRFDLLECSEIIKE